MRNIGLVLVSLSVMSLSGCAKLEFRDANGTKIGLEFYRPEPYLLVSSTIANGTTNKTISVVYLPNCKNKVSVRAKAGLGSVTFNPTLANGWNLTGFASTVDSQTDENITAVAELVTAISSFKRGNNRDANSSIEEGLYSFTFSTDGKISGTKKVNFAEKSASNCSLFQQ